MHVNMDLEPELQYSSLTYYHLIGRIPNIRALNVRHISLRDLVCGTSTKSSPSLTRRHEHLRTILRTHDRNVRFVRTEKARVYHLSRRVALRGGLQGAA